MESMSKGDGFKKRPETAREKPNVWLVRSDSWIFVGHICWDIRIVSHWCLQLKSLGHKSRNHGFLSPIFPLVGPYYWDLDICFSKLRQGASGQPFGKVIIFSSISTNLTLVIPRCWSDILPNWKKVSFFLLWDKPTRWLERFGAQNFRMAFATSKARDWLVRVSLGGSFPINHGTHDPNNLD